MKKLLSGLIVLGAIAAAAAAWAAPGMTNAASTTAPVILESVSTRALSLSGVSLSAPLAQEASIGATEARSLALADQPSGTKVRESALVIVDDSATVPATHCLCWVISEVPPGGVWSAGGSGVGPQRGTYSLWFYNADTGAFVMGLEGGEPQS